MSPSARSTRWIGSPLAVCLLLLLSPGCTQHAGSAAQTDPFGTYTLMTVNGQPLPCAVSHEEATPTIHSGSFAINPDGTCRSTVLFTLPPDHNTTRIVNARFTRDGPRLTMKWEGAGTTIGKLAGDTFTMNNEGMIFEYQKQARP